MNKLITEFIGTFFLVLTIGCTVIAPSAGVIAPLAIGFMLMVMVYAGGHVSGAHYNPAVTLGVVMRGRCPAQDAFGYVLAQILGASLAALAVGAIKGGATAAPAEIAVVPAFLAEFLCTFALVYVILNTATAKGTSGNSFYGLAIGGTVMASAFAVGSISGGAFNPAVAFGGSLLGLFAWSNLWLYLFANLGGGFCAAVVFKLVNPEDK
jgi:aquaporin Z